MKIKNTARDTWTKDIISLMNKEKSIHWFDLVANDNSFFGAYRKGFMVTDNEGHIGISRCHDDDVFDENYGRALAYARLKEIIVPDFSMVPVKDLVGHVINFNGAEYYVPPVSSLEMHLNAVYNREVYCLVPLKIIRPSVSALVMDADHLLPEDCVVDK